MGGGRDGGISRSGIYGKSRRRIGREEREWQETFGRTYAEHSERRMSAALGSGYIRTDREGKDREEQTDRYIDRQTDRYTE